MAVFVGFPRFAPASRGSAAIRWWRRIASEFAGRAAHGWDSAAQIALFLWMALVVALFAGVATGFFLA
jgi:hypothetical protein